MRAKNGQQMAKLPASREISIENGADNEIILRRELPPEAVASFETIPAVMGTARRHIRHSNHHG